jgi:hypothetical protein
MRTKMTVVDLNDMYRSEKEGMLRDYLREGGWRMIEDLPFIPELDRLFRRNQFEPVIFTKGKPTPEEIKAELLEYYADTLAERALTEAEKA